jgi:pectate lyase
VRYGNPVHVFNNYLDNNEVYGIASTVDPAGDVPSIVMAGAGPRTTL